MKKWLLLLLSLLLVRPTHAQTIDWKYLAVNSADAGAAAWDFYETQRCISHGTCVETNPLGQNKAGRVALLVGGPAVNALISWEMKKHHIALWPVFPIAEGVIHGAYAIKAEVEF